MICFHLAILFNNPKILDTLLRGGDMMNHIKISRTFVTVAMVSTLLVTAAPAFAQSTNGNSSPGGFFQGLIQFIEQKFGLDKTQVQSAVQQYQAQRKATITPRPTLTQDQRTTMEKTRLDKLVSSGKISSDQENSILNELSTLQSKYNLSPSETRQQRKTDMQSMQSDLKSWAQQNNINPMYVMPFGMGGGPRGRGMRGGHGNWGNWKTTPTPTPTS
jgi:hypothetical protein